MKIQHVLVSILSLSFSASTFATSFYGDDKYEIVETPMTWSEADAYAKSKGAILVKIETAEQNTWLKDFLKSVDTTAADGVVPYTRGWGVRTQLRREPGYGEMEPKFL